MLTFFVRTSQCVDVVVRTLGVWSSQCSQLIDFVSEFVDFVRSSFRVRSLQLAVRCSQFVWSLFVRVGGRSEFVVVPSSFVRLFSDFVRWVASSVRSIGSIDRFDR